MSLMSEGTEKTRRVSLHQRRKLLRTFRKQYGITLTELGKLCDPQVSQPMLSRFERGKRDLSAESWAVVLGTVSALAREGQGNLAWDPAKRLAGIAKAQKTATKLGAAVALSLHSPSLSEQLAKYPLMPPITTANYTAKELADMLTDVLEIANRAVHDNAIVRDKERFWRAELDKARARIHGLKDVLGLRDKKILTEEAEQQKIDALGMEKIPPAEEETWRAEIEQPTKPKGQTEPDQLADSKAEYKAELRRIGFKEGDK